jgi:predicted DNA-binding WGR domain protein
MDWKTPPKDFRYVTFERINSARNEARIYYLGWQPNLFGEQVLVRVWGRKDGYRKMLVTPFAGLQEAWPTIRALIKHRVRHHYQIVAPIKYKDGP